jgi:hypothetical protein
MNALSEYIVIRGILFSVARILFPAICVNGCMRPTLSFLPTVLAVSLSALIEEGSK